MKIGCAGLILLLAVVLPAWADGVPGSFNYQGVLRDGLGNAMPAAPTRVHFKLYDVPAAGSALWSQDATVLLDSNGLFNVTLADEDGDLAGVIASNANLYLGLTVEGGTEISPRQQLLSVPFALKAGDVSQASGDFKVIGSLNVEDGAVVKGWLQADSVQIGTNTLTTNSYGNGNLTLGGNVDVKDEMHVMQNLTVDGTTMLNGDATISSDLTVDGPTTLSNLTVNGTAQLFTRNSLSNNATFTSWDGSATNVLASAPSDGFIVINSKCYFYFNKNDDNNDFSYEITFANSGHSADRTISSRLHIRDVDSDHGMDQDNVITLPVLKGERVTLTKTGEWSLDTDGAVSLRWYFVPFGTTK